MLALAIQVFGRSASPWTAIDGWEAGWAEMLRTAAVSAVEAPDAFSQGRRYEVKEPTGEPFGSGLWAIVAARKIPSLVPGWRVEAEILAAPALGPTHLRACELEASRLARRLSARQVQLRWYPCHGVGREDRIVKIKAAA